MSQITQTNNRHTPHYSLTQNTNTKFRQALKHPLRNITRRKPSNLFRLQQIIPIQGESIQRTRPTSSKLRNRRQRTYVKTKYIKKKKIYTSSSIPTPHHFTIPTFQHMLHQRRRSMRHTQNESARSARDSVQRQRNEILNPGA